MQLHKMGIMFLTTIKRWIRWLVYHAIRLYLAVGFLAFGASKLLDLQFAWGYEQFDRPVRQLGGMGLVWTFFAYSRPYQIGVGCVEILAALPLLSRRTAALGAVLYLPVISNVVLVDLCYKVQQGGTESALLLFAANWLLIWFERSRISAALKQLLKSPGE